MFWGKFHGLMKYKSVGALGSEGEGEQRGIVKSPGLGAPLVLRDSLPFLGALVFHSTWKVLDQTSA